MKIGIDGYEANIHDRVGIGQYAYQLLKHLYLLDRNNKYFIFLPDKPLPDMPVPRPGWDYVIGQQKKLWTFRELPRLIKMKSDLKVFFSPTHYSPWTVKLPKIISIMDLSYVYFPDLFKFTDLFKLRFLGGRSIRKADRIITISQYTKKDIINYYKTDPQKITVTYPGTVIDEKPINIGQGTKLNIEMPYILFVGTIQPRKNIERLIKAFEKLEMGSMHLVLAGRKGWRYGSIFQSWENSPKKNMIRFLDFVDASGLDFLYRNAGCFVLPSLYEGFGIPVIEAMSYGCPVVVSKTSSLPELTGNLGIYIDPLSEESILHGLVKAIQLSADERKKLATKLAERSRKFSWEECARKTIDVFNLYK